jgi:plasmid stabilization system protein ParE
VKYQFLTPALFELTEAVEYYETQLLGLGLDFIEEIEATIIRILKFPEAWGQISEYYRHCNLRRFPYTLIYTSTSDDEIMIVSVFHQNREPLSWKNNL